MRYAYGSFGLPPAGRILTVVAIRNASRHMRNGGNAEWQPNAARFPHVYWVRGLTRFWAVFMSFITFFHLLMTLGVKIKILKILKILILGVFRAFSRF